MNNFFRCVLIMGICCGLVGFTLAQPPDAGPRVATVEILIRPIKVRNVSPFLIAWWIDPQNQLAPIAIRNARRAYSDLGIADQFLADKKWFGKSNGDDVNTKPLFTKEKPNESLGITGIKQIVSIDSQNVVLAYGTKDGLEQLEKIVSMLDQPVPQIDVEFFQISADDDGSKALGVNHDDKGQLSAQPQDLEKFKANLVKLSAENKVEVLMNPRISMLNTLSGSLGTVQTTALTKWTIDMGGKSMYRSQPPILPEGSIDPAVLISERRSFLASATIQDDGQISLFLNLSNPVSLISSPSIGRMWDHFAGRPITEERDQKWIFKEAQGREMLSSEPSILLEHRTLLRKALHVPNNRLVFVGGQQALATQAEDKAEKAIPKVRRELYFVSAQIKKPDAFGDQTPIAGP